MPTNPYSGKSKSKWLDITRQLVNDHPLKPAALRDAALVAWGTLWQTTVGAGPLSVKLEDLKVPSTIVGYFFETLLARELERCDPLWRGNRIKEEKDLVYTPNPALSVEVKTSGQAGFEIYGNRSYGQKADGDFVKKEKSGFYITVNFYRQTLTLIRFGWIDADDWSPQRAPTGQMAGLNPSVYDLKLLSIPGAYRQQAPIRLLSGVGPTVSAQFADLGIHTIVDLLQFQGALPSRLAKIIQNNRQFLDECADDSPRSAKKS